jgi:multiple sugar transport system permease protein
MLPIFAAVVGALQSERALRADLAALFPREIIWDNFVVIFRGSAPREGSIYSGIAYLPEEISHFRSALYNSLVIALSVTALTLICASLSAYTVARLRMRWLLWMTSVNIFARFVPIIALMIPLYVTFRQMGLLNSLTGVIVAETGFLLPYGILILAPYFAAIPQELEDAARVDGCSRFTAFLRVMLPVSAPILVSFGAIVFIVAWNDLLIPLILNSRPEFMTLPVILVSLIGDASVFFNLMMACALLVMTPSVVLVLLLQKFVVQGLISGAIKG